MLVTKSNASPGLAPLGLTDVMTTNTAPTLGKLNRYNISTGPFTVTLPSIAGLSPGARLAIRRQGTGTAELTIGCYSGDHYDDGDTTKVLNEAWEQIELTVAVPPSDTTKYWVPLGTFNPGYQAAEVVDGGMLVSDADGFFVPADGVLMLSPMAYGAVGDGVTDDTDALNDMITEAANRAIIMLPAGKTFKFTGTLDFGGNLVQGTGWYAQYGWDRIPHLLAGAANAMVTFTTGTLRDLIIDGNDVGQIGVYVGLQDRPRLDNVMVIDFVQAGFVIDSTQNLTATHCSAYSCGSQNTATVPTGWPAIGGWLIINGAQTCMFYNCTTAGESGAASNNNYRGWLICNITADVGGAGGVSRFTEEVFSGGNGHLHWYGGINEYSGNVAEDYPDHRIEILNAAYNMDFVWYDHGLVGAVTDSIVHLGPDAGGVSDDTMFVFHNCLFSIPGTDDIAINAESGRVRITGTTRMAGADQYGMRDKITLSGSASLYMDETCRQLLWDNQRRFDTDTTDSWGASGGTIGYDGAARSLTYSGALAGYGIYVGYRGQGGEAIYGTYNASPRLVRVRCYLTDVVGATGFELKHYLDHAPWVGASIADLQAGYNEVYYLLGDDAGIYILQKGTETASFKLKFIDIEHIAG